MTSSRTSLLRGLLLPSRFWLRRLLALLVVIAIVVTVVLLSNRYLNLETLVENEAALRRTIRESPVAAFLIGFVCYTVVALVIGGQLKTVIVGWLFGFLPAMVLVILASASSACLTVVTSRYLFSDFAERRLRHRMQWLRRAIERDGGQYLFFYRLIPYAPFSPVNWALGLTSLPVTTCWWATLFGMTPQIVLFSLMGARLPSLFEVREKGLWSLLDVPLFAALAGLAILPLAIRWLILRFRGRPSTPPPRTGEETSETRCTVSRACQNGENE
jgi:uncharacterized membrane protein YdjX (TVP38/TMEM64 family)